MKKNISSLLRKIGLIKVADDIRFCILFIKTYKIRRHFKKLNPHVVMPPSCFLYETFSLDYNAYYNKSIDTTKWLVDYFKKYKTLENLKILDWGCGPGRIIRHLPEYTDKTCQFFGTDYNRKYVKWCHENIPNVSFSVNQLTPPLSFNDNTFDIIYGISIFTHLSKEMHVAWFNELIRVLKPNGMLFITLHGNAFMEKLSLSDQMLFKNGNLVVKSNTKEGHRTYAAFQPCSFVHELIGDHTLLEHYKGEVVNNKPQQDVWIIRKVAH